MTWLFIPSSYVPASECSEKASGLHSSIAESDTEPFVTWSGKPVPPRSLSRLWKKERSIKRLSGLTFSRSTAQRGAEAWIASLLDSRARTSQSPGGALVSTESALVFSSTSSTSLPLAVRGSSFWRTSQESYLQPPPLWTRRTGNSSSARPPESWENWPIAGGMRNGRIYARPTWAEVISVSGGFACRGDLTHWDTPDTMPDAPNSGSNRKAQPAGLGNQAKSAVKWLTPCGMTGVTTGGRIGAGGEFSKQVTNWATPDCDQSSYSNGRFGPNIREQAANWPTPAAQDDNKSPEAYRRMRMEKLGRTGEAAETISSLQVKVQAWATPRASMATNGPDSGSAQRQEQGANPGLKDQASQWATPTARDHKDGATTLENVEVNGLLGRQVLTSSLRPVLSINDGRELSPTARTLRPRLNPAFACWLMGWPIWWTNPGITSSVKSEMALYRSRLQQRLSSFFSAQDFV